MASSTVVDLVPAGREGDAIVPTAQQSVFLPVMPMEIALQRREAIVQFTSRIMKADQDFGVIPGTNKPTLLKPGAEKLCNFFGLEPEFVPIVEDSDWTGEHHKGEAFYYVRYRCLLRRDGRTLGVGEGSCNSWESKYRWRTANRKCPKCGAEAIIAGKAEYGGGWLCFGKKGGCGAKFGDQDQAIIGQAVGRVPNPDVADVVNTIQKMAQKRALVAATLIATSASEFFTQDVEDMPPQESAADIRERRIAEDRAKAEAREIPEPLRVAVGKLQAGELAIVKPTFERLQDELLKTAGRDGGAVYDRITAALREKFPQGTPIPKDAMIDCWITLHEECERLRTAKKQTQPSADPPAAAPAPYKTERDEPPAAVVALWERMGDQEGIDAVLGELHADYMESLGAAEGEREFDAIAKARTQPRKMNAPETARRFVRELVERLEQLKTQAAGSRIDDSDVPEIIGGQQQAAMFEEKREVAYAHD